MSSFAFKCFSSCAFNHFLVIPASSTPGENDKGAIVVSHRAPVSLGGRSVGFSHSKQLTFISIVAREGQSLKLL